MKRIIENTEKIFIAGSSGMVGNAVERAFKKKGYEKIFYYQVEKN